MHVHVHNNITGLKLLKVTSITLILFYFLLEINIQGLKMDLVKNELM